ncbi:MAG: hypothetical protein ABI986_00765 [Chloroflexota bacterium]
MKISFEKLKQISEKPWFYPMALFLMAVVTYGYALTSLGYYWSDWEVVFFTKLAPSLQFGFYALDRPYPWTYQLIYFLVGSNPIGWHIVTLLLRWAGTLFFVYALIEFWPEYRSQIFWLGALLIVYPGFVQQAQSAAFSRHIMALFLFTLSLYLMALAIRRPRLARLFFSLSWIATFLHLFTIEYFSGIEFVRPVLIWVLVANGNKKDSQWLRKVVLYSLPYLLITAFFLWVRFVYFPNVFQTFARLESIGSTLSKFQGSFFETSLNFFNRGFLDLLYSTLRVWMDSIIGFDGFTFQRTIAWFAFGLGALFAFGFSFFYNINEEETSKRPSPILMIFIGFLLFVVSALPVWVIGKEISTGGWNVRFSLAPMFGATLMVVGLVLLLVKPSGQKWLFGFLLLFSVATQIWLVNVYRRDWIIQTNYYWQLYWRIPALQSDTAVLSFAYPSNLITHDLDATWAVNVLYHFQIQDGSMPYRFSTPEQEFYFQPNNVFKERARNLIFHLNTSNTVGVLHQTENACLRALDSVYMYDPLLEDDDGSAKLIPVSNLSRILPESASVSPDTDIFGPEPAHTWCYFFEKADLARQRQDWNEVLDLYKQAQRLGFNPEYGAEYIPFIEAFAQTGDWQKAYDLTLAAEKLTPRQKKILCSNWYRFAKMPSADMMMVEKVDQNLSC